MADSLLRQFCADARFYRQLKHPGKPVNRFGAMATALSSRGWWFLVFHRITHYSSFNRNLASPTWWLARILESFGRYLSALLCRSEMLGDCEIKGPVFFSDKGYFLIGAKGIGAGTVLHHRVTLGMAVANGKADRPTIGKDVWIGPDCVIAGGLEIGDGATILPGSCLTFSVPPRAVAKGNPARVIQHGFDNDALRRSLSIITELPDSAAAASTETSAEGAR
jgi:acetyltransferase-like isoleucine patch superfamily enzyme